MIEGVGEGRLKGDAILDRCPFWHILFWIGVHFGIDMQRGIMVSYAT